MSITIHNSKALVPTLIILSFFLSACSLTSNQATSPSPTAVISPPASSAPVVSAPVSQVSDQPALTTDATGSQVYTQVVSYNNPAGGDVVGFTVTVDRDGTITDAATVVKAEPTHVISVILQNKFAVAIKEQVVGKKLSGLEVDRVGGASLTTGAFNKFLTAIQT